MIEAELHDRCCGDSSRGAQMWLKRRITPTERNPAAAFAVRLEPMRREVWASVAGSENWRGGGALVDSIGERASTIATGSDVDLCGFDWRGLSINDNLLGQYGTVITAMTEHCRRSESALARDHAPFVSQSYDTKSARGNRRLPP